MADYRAIRTELWRVDERFEGLELDAKLFYLYLRTNPAASVAGIYRLTESVMIGEMGITREQLRQLKAQFSEREIAHFEGSVIWVRGMREEQLELSPSPRMQTRLRRDIEDIPDCDLKRRYLAEYGHPTDTLPIGSAYPTDRVSIPCRELELELELEQEQEQNSSSSGVAPAPNDDDDHHDDFATQCLTDFGRVFARKPSKQARAEVTDIAARLRAAGVPAWWELAAAETSGAPEPSWRYMRQVLETCLTENRPPGNGAGNGERGNGHGPPARKRGETVSEYQQRMRMRDALESVIER